MEKMKQKYTVVIHGPFEGNAYDDIYMSLCDVNGNISNVVISTYIDSKNDVKPIETMFASKFNTYTVFSEDIINPGYFNLNRQILLVRAALNYVDDDSIIIKIRNDQWCKMKPLLKILDKLYSSDTEERFLTTNCFTRMDRYYHPSDMFLCGRKKFFEEYYSFPYQMSTHDDIQLQMIEKLRSIKTDFTKILVSPESELFKNYLINKKWNLKYTFDDSFQALKKYVYMINTWDISLRWNKQRNAFLPAKTIILPYKFDIEPFADAPVEKARCYCRSDFNGYKTLKDIIFIFFSKLVFSIKYNRIHNLLLKLENKIPVSLVIKIKKSKYRDFIRNVMR